jgi:hypothetical protein
MTPALATAGMFLASIIGAQVQPPTPPEAQAPASATELPSTSGVEPNEDAPSPPTDREAADTEAVEFAEQATPEEPVEFQDPAPEQAPVEFASPTKEQFPGAIDYSPTEGKAPMIDAAAVALEPVVPFTGTPQRFAIEVKFGPYLPNVDGKYPGPGLGAYAEVFGKTDSRGVAVGQPRDRLMTRLGFEWQFINVGGPLSLGTSIGFFQDRAQAILVQTQPSDPTTRSDADRVRFSVFPMTLMLGYRFELLADRFNIPLVPYARGGLAYGFWWASNGDGDISVNDAGVKGSGGSAGWQANLGMMLRLDFLEPSAAKALDSATGINHTYIFGEWQFSRMDGFGSLMNKVSVGDDTWYLGLAIEI